jgi:hypothetical protein
VELLFGAAVHLRSVDSPTFQELSSDEDVLGDREVWKQPHLLMDQADPRCQGVVGPADWRTTPEDTAADDSR